ncbi:Transcriptional regulator, TetR family [Microbacterium sp. C448]|uniref:TetR/AcrR family transcriptional regulator n=1 Tax=Microbacterium lacus TaxID=415217 RepID=UPI0003DE466D|nr:TetR/AcrR family transcriptional regulator [Microbacterium lacus]CDK00505.1 Transcriptional regulator, TetR family [Microbacterium sp. C448]
MVSLDLVDSSVKTPALSYRQSQAESTRVRIAEAAQRLFARDGYAATSMSAIAHSAGVGNRTVYAAFGAKREILNLICEIWLERAGARSLAREILADPDPLQRLRGAARWLTTLYATDFDVVRILDSAIDEDAETREVLRAKLRGRNRVMDALIASVEKDLSMSLADAQAIFRAYAAAGVYGELVMDSGWSAERFERWLADTLVAQLFASER